MKRGIGFSKALDTHHRAGFVGDMLTEPIPFPNFNSVALDLGFFQIRWYALAYIGGLVLGWWYLLRLLHDKWWPDGPPMTKQQVEDFVFWSMLGVILGGRLGYVLFYKPGDYLSDPLSIFMVWEGGMSFHGGLLGVITVIIWFSLKRGISMYSVGDLVGCVVPIGLLLGRIANFINGELYGRPTGGDYGIIFGGAAGPEPRHPSQLYEAFLEGLVLFIVLRLLFSMTQMRFMPGALCGTFLIGYGASRIIVEFFREPDDYLGFLWFGASMGQLLSIPMVLFGIWLIWNARRQDFKPA
ncbi:MAG: prolipoprotein diacylglyceryl transferase [Alphaproteobacteria bacterium]